MKRTSLAIALSGLLVLAACSARGDDSTDTTAPPAPETTAAPETTEAPDTTEPTDTTEAPETTDAPETTEAPEPEGPMFGTLQSPCGPAPEGVEVSVDPSQNGGSTIKVGTATDKDAEVRPGLNQEIHDAAVAFVAWCNEQGGVRGLPLELVELNGGLFNVPAAIETACDQVFAMVGGGLVLDDQSFPRFHECGMVDIAAYTVTPAKAESNGMAQPVPNPALVKPAAWLIWARDYHADDVQNAAIITGNLATTEFVADQLEETMGLIGGWNVTFRTSYNSAGESNWVPFAQQLKDRSITAMTFVGEPGNLVNLLRAMDEVDYKVPLILQEANFYDEAFAVNAGALGDGVVARTAYSPFEEPDRYPGQAAYQEMMATYNPSGKQAGLGLQSTSAYLLFATAAGNCIDNNGGVLERECMLAEAKAITSWTGGGLHDETNPGDRTPPACTILMVMQDGQWDRLFPEIGSADDNGNGFWCPDDGIVTLTGDYGDLSAGRDPNRPN